MGFKKQYIAPEFEVVRFDENDLITDSLADSENFGTAGVYNLNDIFNLKISN